jgi:RecA/RadA recombinase
MGNKRKIGVLLREGDLRRRYPESGLASKISLPAEKVLKLPCRILAINNHLGGGISYGKIIEVGGEESAGKTLLAIDFGVVAQSMGGIVLWDDAEASFDRAWAEKNGLDMDKVELLPYENEIELVSDWIADMCIYYRSKLTNNEPILLVVDSIAVFEGGDAMETAEQDTKAEMGRRSYKMGQLLRKRTKIFAKYGICVLFINQIRKKVGASKFENPDTTPLAQVMKYYASQRLFLFRGKRLRLGGGEKGSWVGNLVYVRTMKSKTSAPKDNIQAKVYFREDGGKLGYDKYFGFSDLLLEMGILTKKSGRFFMRTKRKGHPAKTIEVAHGEKALEKRIIYDAELRGKLIRKSGVNTPSTFREQLADLTTNLYPVRMKVAKEKSQEDENEE